MPWNGTQEVIAGYIKNPHYDEMTAGDRDNGNYTGIDNQGNLTYYGAATRWDEVSQPMIAANLYTTAGRIDYDYDELTVDFAANARYPDDPVAVVLQLSHRRKELSGIRPHLHWIQTSDAMPNILISYRCYDNGAIATGSWTLKALTSSDNMFPYIGVGMQQITEFNIAGDCADLGLSGTFEVKMYRDVTNASGLFAGADTYTGPWKVKYYDIHLLLNTSGSDEEFVK